MIKRILHLLMMIFLISCAVQAQAQEPMPDQVCVGTTHHYWVEGLPGSVYTWRVNGEIQNSSSNEIDILWSEVGDFTLEVQEHQGECDGDVQTGLITVTDLAIPEFSVANEYCIGALIGALPTTSNNGITGTWTPEINNTQTTTYTFTPDDEQCAVPYELTISITDGIIPTFEAIAAICSGSPALTLPTTSQNNITGSWSPAFNNTATTEYTFTPDNGQCATTATLTVVVNEEVTPIFDPVSPVCRGEAIAALPTTSTNGITGTWSPAIDNTRTTTYTFTPDDEQCAVETTLTITITEEITPVFAQVSPYCLGSTIDALPTRSTNGITGSWSPAIDNTQTTEYTFTPDAGQCGEEVTMTITISDEIIPNFAQVGPYCAGSAIPELPTTSINNITGSWSPAIDNTRTATYTFTPDAGQCGAATSMTITISDEIIPTFAQVGPYCAGSAIPELPTTSINNITGSWNPAIDNTRTATYTFTPDAGQCGTTTAMTITISDEIIPTFAQVGPFCAGSAIPELPTTSINNITGSWNPAIDNTRTATYTFTPDAGQCGTATTMTITISDEIIPSFAQVGPYCTGSALDALPTTSINNITGSWSPAIDNTRTATYTFTPDTGQCGTATTMTITISDEIIPTFAQVGPYCAGAAIPELPTTSTNNITGTWSPAIDNTRTATYTFTPDDGQCGTATSMTITISDEIIPTFAQVGPYCAGSAIPELPTTSINNITGSWNPAMDNTRTATYTFTPDDGQCGTTTTMTITISDEIIPTFAQVGPFCAGSAIDALPTTSINNITGSWSPAIDNTRTATYTFTPDAGQCGTTTAMTITISDEIIPTFAQVGPYCAGNAIPELPTTSTNNITGSWTPAIDNTRTATYTFTPDTGQCGTATTMTITISDEIIPTFAQVGPYCAGAAIPELPTTSTNNITGTWSPAIDNTRTVTYTFTPDAGQCGTATTMTIAISDEIIPTFAQVGPYNSGSLIADLPIVSNNGITGTWSPALNNTQTTTYTFTPDPDQCAVQTTLTIVINGEMIPAFDPVGPLCSGSVIAALPTTSINGITGSWSPAINNTQTTTYTFTPDTGQGAVTVTLTIEITNATIPVFDATGPYCPGDAIAELPTVSNNDISGSWSPAINNTQTTTYTFSPDEGQCATTASLTIIIEQSNLPTFEAVGPYCPGNNVADLPTVSTNGITGSWSPEIDNTQTTTYTFTPDEGQCASIATLTIVMEGIIVPEFNAMAAICSGEEITLPSVSNNGISGSWSPDINNTQTTTYTFTPDAGQCGVSTTLTVEVNRSILPEFDTAESYCPGDVIAELPTVSNNDISGTWNPAINNQQTTTYTFTPDDGQCAGATTLTIVINQGIIPTFDPVGPYCQGDAIADLPTVSNNNISGIWNPAIDNSQSATYTFTPDDGQCASTTMLSIVIEQSVTPIFDAVGPYCPGATITALPTVSANGIRGSWSPAIDNSQTTTYTFTADDELCPASTTLTIVIDQNITPTFDPVGPFCPGTEIAVLPIVSTNGISGSWSPAIDNTQTTTYTFTPEEGQCGVPTMLTIEITDQINPSFDAMAPVCSGTTFTLPLSSREGIAGTWSPEIDNNRTTEYTFTPVGGACATSATLTVEVLNSATPEFSLVGPFCPGADIAELPSVSNNNIRGSWSPAINNMTTTTYTFIPDEGQCAEIATLTIEIGESIAPTFLPVGSYCRGASIASLPTVSREGISGSWSPDINNQQSTTYTFTPEDGQCASVATLTVLITDQQIPEFDAVGTYCPGADMAALPSTSNNSITGSWSPALNNWQTTTYTFTPDEGQCATTASMTIVVDANMVPEFDALASVCSGAVIQLPDVSNNGISGDWSPAVNNTRTTTYTFTPDEGQCAIPASLTVEVEQNIIPTFEPVDPYCQGADIAALPNVSNNGIRGSWSPEINNSQTTTYTFTPDEGQCAQVTTLTININDEITPVFAQAGPYCAGSVIPALPATSNNGISGTWSPAINNTRTTTYVFTPAAGQCAANTTLTVVISDEITPIFNQPAVYCVGSVIAALPTISNNGIRGSWSPVINNQQTTTYTFTPASGQCGSPASLTIEINDEVIPTFDPVNSYTRGSTIQALPTTSTNGIRGTWSPAINNQQTTTYTFTPNAGQCAVMTTLAIEITDQVIPTFDPVGPYCSGSVIAALPTISINGISGTWSPAINNRQTITYTFTPDAGQSAGIARLTITIDPEVRPIFAPVGPYCTGAVIDDLPTTSTNGITGSWSPAINNQQTTTYSFTPDAGQCAANASLTIVITDEITPTFASVGPYCAGAVIDAMPVMSNNGIRGSWSPEINNTRTTTYTFTPDAGQCAGVATMTIAVNPSVTPVFDPAGPYCRGTAIAALPIVSINGIRGSWSPAINNTQTTTYTFTPDAGQCAVPVTMTIEITDEILPVFDASGPYCPGSAIAQLPNVSNNGITGTWRPAINNRQTTTYTFTPDRGQCGITTTMTIAIEENAIPTFAQVGPYCAGSVIAELPTVSTNGISGSWRPAINNNRTTTYTFTPDAGQCGVSTSMTITVTNPVTPTFDPVGPFCPGAVIADLSLVSTNGITGTWSPAINNQQSTNYTFTPDQGQCASTATLRIVIDQRTVPTFDPVASYCSGSAITALHNVSNNGIRGSWRPAINNRQTTTYTFTPDAGQCGETTTMTIEITDEVDPVFDQVGPYPRGAAIAALHNVSNNGIRGTWRPAINNDQTTTYTFTPDAGQCSRPSRMTIAITEDIIPVFNPVGPYCREAVIADLPTVSTNGIRGTWSPAINNTQTTTYTFTPEAGQSATYVTMTITISDEIIPTFDPVRPSCPGSTIAALPVVSNNGIRGSWSPEINNQVTTVYTFTPDADQCALSTTLTIEIGTDIVPEFDLIGPFCPGTPLESLPVVSKNGIRGRWSPVMNNMVTTNYLFTPHDGQCATETSLTCEIGSEITPLFNQAGPYCMGSTIAALPTTSTNGVSGTWSPAIDNTQTTTYTFTPEIGRCALTTTMTITILEETEPTFAPVRSYCEGSTIAALPTTSLNGINGTWSPAIDNTRTTTYTFTPNTEECATTATLTIVIGDEIEPTFIVKDSYCEDSEIEALPVVSSNGIVGLWSPAIDNTRTTTYTFTPNAGQCATTATMVITIDQKVMPSFTPVSSYCPGSVIPDLPVVSNNGILGTWSPAINNQLTTNYTFTPNADQCAHTVTLTIEIKESIVPVFAQPDMYCAGTVISALPGTSTNGIRGTWSPAINNTQTTTYTFTPVAGQCATTAELTILINANPATPVASVKHPDCNVSTGTIDVVSPRGTQYHYRLDGGIYQPGTLFSGLAAGSSHTVQVRDVLTGCESALSTVTINSLPQPPQMPVVILAANPGCEGEGVIQITNPTGSDYEYRMDGGAYQSMNTFTNVTWGEHLLTVRNKINGCVSAATRIFIPEIEADMDYDGIPDATDIDVDGDGIINSLEGNSLADLDRDDHMNYMDIDADGDGIVDNMEAQASDDYILPEYKDSDNDGLDDAYDADQGGTELRPVNTDRIDAADFLDLDADNDLVPDHIEGHDEDSNGKADHLALGDDSDNDGLDDAYDMIANRCGAYDNALGSNAPTQDFDLDGDPDWRDENDDDDEYLTRFEDLNADNDFSNDDIDFDGYPEYLDYGRDCDLFIPDAFSPNGDNVHDLYMIYCINHYPNATIYIFDQLGNKIFEKAHYGNLEFWKLAAAAWWDGKPTRGPGYSRNNRVPPGTYYYVLDLGNGEVKKSYVFVSY